MYTGHWQRSEFVKAALILLDYCEDHDLIFTLPTNFITTTTGVAINKIQEKIAIV